MNPPVSCRIKIVTIPPKYNGFPTRVYRFMGHAHCTLLREEYPNGEVRRFKPAPKPKR